MQVTADVETLRKARYRKGWGRVAAAERAGLSVSHLRDIERGRRQPSLAAAFKLASVYEVTIDDLVTVEQ